MVSAPHFTITDDIAAALTKIERARGFLEAAKLSRDWIRDMQKRALVLEAHHTTHIEGSRLSLQESETLLSGKRVPGADPDDVRELLNYRRAFELVADYVQEGDPISEDVIQAIHRRLVEGVRGGSARPGEYRKVQNYIVNALREIVYTPPAPKEVPELMKALVSWLGKPGKIHPVLLAGSAQFRFVDIHPFVDGNGRTARLLSTLCLYRAGYDFKRLFTISEYYDRDRPAYYRAIQTVRERKGDQTSWLEYFTEGLATQLAEVRQRGEGMMRKDLLLARARTEGLRERPLALLGFLLKRGKGSVSECVEALKGNRRTLQRDLKVLVQKRLVREIGASPTDPTRHYEPLL